VMLLPCPFCGRDPSYGSRSSDHTRTVAALKVSRVKAIAAAVDGWRRAL
jgi:hypothetical protein